MSYTDFTHVIVYAIWMQANFFVHEIIIIAHLHYFFIYMKQSLSWKIFNISFCKHILV